MLLWHINIQKWAIRTMKRSQFNDFWKYKLVHITTLISCIWNSTDKFNWIVLFYWGNLFNSLIGIIFHYYFYIFLLINNFITKLNFHYNIQFNVSSIGRPRGGVYFFLTSFTLRLCQWSRLELTHWGLLLSWEMFLQQTSQIVILLVCSSSIQTQRVLSMISQKLSRELILMV